MNFYAVVDWNERTMAKVCPFVPTSGRNHEVTKEEYEIAGTNTISGREDEADVSAVCCWPCPAEQLSSCSIINRERTIQNSMRSAAGCSLIGDLPIPALRVVHLIPRPPGRACWSAIHATSAVDSVVDGHVTQLGPKGGRALTEIDAAAADEYGDAARRHVRH